MRRALVIAALLVVAAVCGFLAYGTFSHTRPGRDRWAEAATSAQRAEHTKGQLPAIQIRERAADLFLEVARSGPLEIRSRAVMLAGLLQARNAAADPTQSRRLLVAATGSLRRAIRLDPQNDDAAYDLELLLLQAGTVGRPNSRQAGLKRKQKEGTSTSTPGEPGTGY